MPETKRRATAKPGSSARQKTNKASAKRSRTGSKSRQSRANNGAGANGAAKLDAARHTVEDKAKEAGKTVAGAASRAKLPLIAGGAALAGAAGGLALGARGKSGRRVPHWAARRPRIKLTSHDVAKAAKGVGSFSNQVGALATEVERLRQAADGQRHRSPIEVVLQGLTTRR
jgi:hypothetical protein